MMASTFRIPSLLRTSLLDPQSLWIVAQVRGSPPDVEAPDPPDGSCADGTRRRDGTSSPEVKDRPHFEVKDRTKTAPNEVKEV